MDKKELLFLEEDDAGIAGNDGKHVFVAKRINGKTTHNKVEDIENFESRKFKDIEEQKNDEITLGMENFYFPDGEYKEKNKNKKVSKKKNKKGKKNIKIDKRERKRLKRQKSLRVLILLLIIAGMIIFMLISPIFNIEKIIVNGNEQISSDTIISLSGLEIGNNIFRNLSSEVIKNIKENAYIENVTMKRKFPNTIEISVEERKIAYQIKVVDSNVYIDYQGYILDKSTETQNVPIIEGLHTSQNELLNSTRLVSEDISYLNTILKIAENAKKLEIYSLINKIIIENNEFVLYLPNEKKYVYLGNNADITNKMLYVKAILEKEKKNSGKIFVNGDLNDGFKPYFREEKIK